MVEGRQNIPPAIQAAIEEIKIYYAVEDICIVSINKTVVTVETKWAVRLPNAFEKKGVSNSGIQKFEQVFWQIPLDYPIHAPFPLLREEFPTNIPHINPYRSGDLVNPCVSEVSLDDLLHSMGLHAILNATSQWLNNAAADELHCPVQGWEYVRRDSSAGMVIVDTHSIREELDISNKAVRFYRYRYFHWSGLEGLLIGSVTTPHLGSENSCFKRKFTYIDRYSSIRNAPGILFQTRDGVVINEYRPEMVTDFNSLRAFAKYLGLKEVFDARLKYILTVSSPESMHRQNKEAVEEFMVTFAVKRPFSLIGTHNSWELLPYRVSYNLSKNSSFPDNTVVHPIRFVERCCTQLLQSVSGIDLKEPVNLALLGCGSLGSKIALHFAKSGGYRFELIDKDMFSNHNNARHGLVVADLDNFTASKSQLLHQEISKLNVMSNSLDKDIRDIGKKGGFSLNKETDYIIDTTASLSVRHFLAHKCKTLSGQLIHAILYGGATMGVVAIEDVGRSVRVDDLMVYTNTLCIDDSSIEVSMYGKVNPELNHYGEGCGSVTTTMSDIDISLMSAAISSKINGYITQETKQNDGLLYVGVIVDKKSLNMCWKSFDIPSTFVIRRDIRFKWDIRVLGHVTNKIKQLSSRNGTVENGGVLAGQICSLSNTIYISYLLDAPSGSIRTANKFELSTDGLQQKFDEIHGKTNGQVTFLGTWHSHTQACPPSLKDKKSLNDLQSNYDLPIVMLTYTGGRIVRV